MVRFRCKVTSWYLVQRKEMIPYFADMVVMLIELLMQPALFVGNVPTDHHPLSQKSVPHNVDSTFPAQCPNGT